MKAHWSLAVLVAACADTSEGDFEVPAADAQRFREQVYPVLLADCGFAACHGDQARFFRIWGPGRVRLDPSTDPYAPPTSAELAESFTRARSMLIASEGVARSPLLRKPLAVAAGGAGHRGEDPWGANVYLTKQDPRFTTLFFWATAEVTP